MDQGQQSGSPPAQGGWTGVMGMHLVQVTKDEVVGEWEVDERHLQPMGIVNGGVHCTAIESLCSTGAYLNVMDQGKVVVGLDNHTSFVRAVRPGTKLRAVARPITRGRTAQLWEAEVRDADGKLVATGRVRLLCMDEKGWGKR
ncbi:MAG: PaaI family thioesterase [Myxococcota bacterium]